MPSMKMARVILFTGRIDAMSEFYGQVLGLNQITNEKSWKEFDAGGARIALHSGPSSPGRKGPKIVFYADDVSNDCGRQPDGISFIEEFIVLSSSLTPSAECLQLFDKKLQLHSTLYGFGPVLVAPGQIVMIENMIHFAPVHPERLQLVDLHSGAIQELYPPKNDQAREHLAGEHARHMPSKELCMSMNDPCAPTSRFSAAWKSCDKPAQHLL